MNDSIADAVRAKLAWDERVVQMASDLDQFLKVDWILKHPDHSWIGPSVIEKLFEEHARTRALTEALADCVSALTTLRNETKGTLKAHEIAIRYDSGNSNFNCLELALTGADEALAKVRAVLEES